jgi:hypothetical protein
MHVDIDIRTVVSGVPDNYRTATHKVLEKFASYFKVLKEICFCTLFCAYFSKGYKVIG